MWSPGLADTVCHRPPLMTQVQHFVNNNYMSLHSLCCLVGLSWCADQPVGHIPTVCHWAAIVSARHDALINRSDTYLQYVIGLPLSLLVFIQVSDRQTERLNLFKQTIGTSEQCAELQQLFKVCLLALAHNPITFCAPKLERFLIKMWSSLETILFTCSCWLLLRWKRRSTFWANL